MQNLYQGKEKIHGIITARSGSKGIPGKNMKLLCGKPLLFYVSQASLNSNCFEKIYLSTDSEEIANYGIKLGLDVPFLRPVDLAGDKTKSIEVILDIVEKLNLDGSICLINILAGNTFSAEYVVDMSESSALAPRPAIDRPNVADGVELVATITCEFPWDIDSDPSDNEARIILSGSGESEGGFSDSSTAIASASLVIGISIAFAWMARNFRESKEMMERTRLAVEKKALEKKANVAKKMDSPSQKVVQEEDVVDNLGNITEVPTEEIPGEIEDSLMDSFEERLNRLKSDK